MLAAVVNSLEAWLVFGIARRLRAAPGRALAAAAALVVLPIFLARLSLAYFPALVGHAVDAVVILYPRPRCASWTARAWSLALGALIALALLTYTQSLLNFAVLLPLLVVAAPRRRSRARDARGAGRARGRGRARRRCSRSPSSTAATSRSSSTCSGASRWPEERILLEKPSARRRPRTSWRPPGAATIPTRARRFDPLRGVRKAAWRLYVFYGALRARDRGRARPRCGARRTRAGARVRRGVGRVTYLVLNLASGGLPGPEPRPLQQGPRGRRAALLPRAGASSASGSWRRSRAARRGAFGAAPTRPFGVAARPRATSTEKFVLER